MHCGIVSIFLKYLNFIAPDSSQEETAIKYTAGIELVTKYVVEKYELVTLTANWVEYYDKHQVRPLILCQKCCEVFCILKKNIS